MHFKRREFLQVGSLATATMMLPKFLKAFEQPNMVPAGNKVVVVIQFSGGNDGLNTVIPISNDLYFKAWIFGKVPVKAKIMFTPAGLAATLIINAAVVINLPRYWK